MPAGDLFTASIKEIAAGGGGAASAGGMTVFIDMTAPGDLVKARITREHGRWAKAELVEILEPSPLRIAPACPLYGICGGCSLQHLAYEAQLEAKTAILKNAFARIGGVEAPEPDIIPSPPWEYRNRMQFHCAPRFHREAPGLVSVGLKARKSAAVIPVSDCPVADRGIRGALKNGTIRPPPEKDRFTVYSRGGLFLCEGENNRGKTTLRGRGLILDAEVFFQGNAFMLEKLIGDLIQRAAPRNLPAADVYCGVGTFALFLKDLFPRIDLVEENKTALALARENVKGEGIEYFAMKDEDWAGRKKAAGGTNPVYGFIVADPPRQGLSPGIRRWLVEKGPPLFAYVSCDPASMARDGGELISAYDLEKLSFYDFYPQTAHIESLGIFRRKPRFSPRH
ncbi:MAG: methyltransferase [Treponema sp.]|jgi:23S rRNA (uracil1939-C5)-methyltransferase|nr:methyltransferase [Treponema sp.]